MPKEPRTTFNTYFLHDMKLNKENSNDEELFNKTQFQQELDKWFSSHGVIADLRSHLRHLMIMSLQNTRIGLKSTERASPKIQAINLLIAEQLLWHKYHYTLSVFTSEVPALNGFSDFSIKSLIDNERKKRKKNMAPEKNNIFMENELDDIFNALGLSTNAYVREKIKNEYFQNSNKSSLLELILQLIFEMFIKLEIHQNLESVTEIELNKMAKKKHRQQIELLTQREMRIQESLRKYENDIFYRLKRAEMNLFKRRERIDEELNEKQKYLSKMVSEWKMKHDEIIEMSKNVLALETENKKLNKVIRELQKENKNLKVKKKKQNQTIKELLNAYQKVFKWNSVLKEQLKKSIDINIRESCQDENINNNDSEHNNSPKDVFMSDYEKISEGDRGNDDDDDDDINEEMTIMNISSDEVICSVKKKLDDLEKESKLVNDNYYKYKNKYVDCILSESDTSLESSIETLNINLKKSNECLLKCDKMSNKNQMEKFSQTEQGNQLENFIFKMEEMETKRKLLFDEVEKDNDDDDDDENNKPHQNLMQILKTPSKRQLENREYFLENRKLLISYEENKNFNVESDCSFRNSNSSEIV
ncbi:conserved hypothetical protein [Pediculus humanus corporis]|uniref:Uncharacterized protein n=1 Tax=Pediculus humanus subsp. corporis TaxID=121224 RepID=E0VV18_PEDHC|nr:uncharacterized protein Phum_PHUM457780 [Pediculus humanus corporis]EEB17224.1 conserved hypothetical protein [Pediculus humanus corporis]